jgi:flagellar FliJ protein
MEKVLEWKTDKEKTTMEEFASLQNDLQIEKMLLNGLQTQYTKCKENNLKSCSVNELMHQHLYIQTISEKIEEQNHIIYTLKDIVEESRMELVAAQKDRKIMEKLKEKDKTNYLEDVKLMEQKELDEMAVIRFNRLAY